MNKVAFLPLAAIVALPAAALTPDFDYLDTTVEFIGVLIGLLVPVVIALGLLLFIWGLVQFIFASGDEAAKDEGKRKMIWGVVTLFVIVAVWGLVALLSQLTGISTEETYVPSTVELVY